MKKLITIAVLALSLQQAAAQQDPQFTQFMFNKLWVNPGAAGASDAICANFLGRSQWIGFEGHPTTFMFSADMPINSINSGVGLTFYQDKLGEISTTAVKAAYAYRLKLGTGRLGLGVDLGYLGKVIGTGLNPLTPDVVVDAMKGQSAGSFDVSFGAHYSNEKLYFGISATHLTGQNFRFKNNTEISAAQHFWAQGGYNWALSPTFELRPSFLIKTDFASAQVDVNVMAVVSNRYWAGLSYRLQDALAINIGVDIWKGLRLGLAYDLTTSKINQYSSGSGEIYLGYCFKIDPPAIKTKYFNSRNLSDR